MRVTFEYTGTRTHAHARTHAHTHARTHTHTRTHARARTHMHTHMHTRMRARARASRSLLHVFALVYALAQSHLFTFSDPSAAVQQTQRMRRPILAFQSGTGSHPHIECCAPMSPNTSNKFVSARWCVHMRLCLCLCAASALARARTHVHRSSPCMHARCICTHSVSK